MSAPELSRPIKARHLPAEAVVIDADPKERDALAARFGVTAVHALRAELSLENDGEAVLANGRLEAEIEQPCAISGDSLRYPISEPIALRFVPDGSRPEVRPDEEIELESNDLDVIEFDGESFDLGEAVAQSLGLAIDPYAVGPGAEAVREAGLVTSEYDSGPFAALAALRKRVD